MALIKEMEYLEREEEERAAAQADILARLSSKPSGDTSGLISDVDWAAVLGSASWDPAVLDSDNRTG